MELPQKPLELKKENVTSAFLAQCTWRGPFHPHHDEYPPSHNYSWSIFSHSSFIRASQRNTCVSFFLSALGLFIFLFRGSYSAFTSSPQLSTPGFLCHLWYFMQHHKCYWRGWEGRHEGIKSTAPRQRRGEGSSAEYWGNHPDKGNQAANGPCNSVESFRSQTTG